MWRWCMGISRATKMEPTRTSRSRSRSSPGPSKSFSTPRCSIRWSAILDRLNALYQGSTSLSASRPIRMTTFGTMAILFEIVFLLISLGLASPAAAQLIRSEMIEPEVLDGSGYTLHLGGRNRLLRLHDSRSIYRVCDRRSLLVQGRRGQHWRGDDSIQFYQRTQDDQKIQRRRHDRSKR